MRHFIAFRVSRRAILLHQRVDIVSRRHFLYFRDRVAAAAIHRCRRFTDYDDDTISLDNIGPFDKHSLPAIDDKMSHRAAAGV